MSDTIHQPHDLEAEQAVIGSILLDNSQLDEVRALITPECFYAERHRVLYRHCLKLTDAGAPVEHITLRDSLNRTGDLDKAGGTLYLLGLPDAVGVSVYSEHYARIVARHHTARQALAAGQKIQALALDPELTADELTARALETAGGVQSSAVSEAADLAAGAERAYQAGKARARGEVTDGALPTGLSSVDRMMRGFRPGKLYVLAARPGLGKSALALTFALAAARQGALTLFYSLEMQDEEIAVRAACQLARVDAERVDLGTLTPQEETRYWAARDTIRRLQNDSLKVITEPDLTLEALRASTRRISRGNPVGLIVVDYLQLMRYAGKAQNREQEVSGLSRGLKKLAMTLPAPVLALGQLNRDVESRPDRRPVLSDLRESGGVEQDADTVMMLYREDAYDPTSAQAGIAELLFRKQRGGKVGTVKLQWHAAHVTFNELALSPAGRVA
jgi:replicative DNA helicase